MSRVSEIDPALIGSFIASVLQADDGLSGSELLLREISFVFLGFLRPDPWFPVFMHLKKLKNYKQTYITNLKSSHDPI